jgi:prepilin-type N-terminal cleavage/methylation domain-containing protein
MAYTRNSGFTLIELLVVIAIIGLLSSVVLASLNTARAKARDAQRESNLIEIQQAVELYANDHNGQYPVVSGYEGVCAGWNPGNTLTAANMIPGLVPTYISTIPQDPAMNASGNTDCILYYSDGTGYKILDYNMIDSPSPGAHEQLVDPERNYGQPYPRPGACSNSGSTEGTVTWAVYTPTFMCF